MAKTPTQLDREIKQALAERAQRAYGVDTIRPRSHTGQSLPINRPPPQHGVDIIRPRTGTGTGQAALIDRPVLYGVDTIQPRGRAGQPASMSRQPPALHGVNTIKPRRSTSHAQKKIAKTKIMHVVQGNYGYGQGWEDLTADDEPKEALARLREYRENELGGRFRRIRRRQNIQTSHARKKKLDPHETRSHLEAAGVDFSRDFHELPRSNVELLLNAARAAGYRKRKDAPGSTARMYFQYLSRLR